MKPRQTPSKIDEINKNNNNNNNSITRRRIKPWQFKSELVQSMDDRLQPNRSTGVTHIQIQTKLREIIIEKKKKRRSE